VSFVGRGRCFRVLGWEMVRVGESGIGDGSGVDCGIRLFS
jgi:hypothetical protein